MTLLRRSCEELQQTVVVVSHDPRAAAFADRVVFLKDGNIVRETEFSDREAINTKLDRLLQEMRDLGL
jgi:putative ABC transport system ATP-binding protein